jgi:hypothetical protein
MIGACGDYDEIPHASEASLANPSKHYPGSLLIGRNAVAYKYADEPGPNAGRTSAEHLRKSSRNRTQHAMQRRGCDRMPASIFYVQRPASRGRLELRQRCRNPKTGCTPVPKHLLLRPRHRGTSGTCGHNPVPQDGEECVPKHAAFIVQTIMFVLLVTIGRVCKYAGK